jgi:hypothetical protein
MRISEVPEEGRRVEHNDSGSIRPANGDALYGDVAGLIDGARQSVAATVNSELVMLYWSVGKRVREEVLGGERGEYGQQHVLDSAIHACTVTVIAL